MDGDERPEDRRNKNDQKLLDSIDYGHIMDMYSSDEKGGAKEYQTDDPFALQQKQLVKIAPKSKKQRMKARKAAQENEE